MKKRTTKKEFANWPRLQEYILLICLNYGFTGVNFIILGMIEVNKNKHGFYSSIMLGIVMLCMVPISYFDPRKENRDKSYAIVSCIIHFVLSLFMSYTFWWIMVFYAVEVVISISIVFIIRQIWIIKKRGRKRRKK